MCNVLNCWPLAGGSIRACMFSGNHMSNSKSSPPPPSTHIGRVGQLLQPLQQQRDTALKQREDGITEVEALLRGGEEV